jgi:hypothetical protein
MPVLALIAMFASCAHTILVSGRDHGKNLTTLSWLDICMAASWLLASIATGYFRVLFSTVIAI